MNTGRKNQITSTPFLLTAAVIGMTFVTALWGLAASGQKTFSTEQQAVDSFIQALKEDNKTELMAIFGSDAQDLIYSGDPVADRRRREMFIEAYNNQHRLEAEGEKRVLIVGLQNWPFPIPLQKQGQQWIFDTAAGQEEILNRRIGSNELNTIQVLLAIVDAQREYAMQDRNGNGRLEYARKFMSEPGAKDGLYWETQEGEEPSPLGILVARAKQEGFVASDKPQPYWGYYYRMLTAQGENAPGSAFDYIVNGHMIGGFAVIAYPAVYGSSGVMTFIVNYEGIVYQKDLGEDTVKKGLEIQLYNPDTTWTRVQQEEVESPLAREK